MPSTSSIRRLPVAFVHRVQAGRLHHNEHRGSVLWCGRLARTSTATHRMQAGRLHHNEHRGSVLWCGRLARTDTAIDSSS
jgi:hypothetical protein